MSKRLWLLACALLAARVRGLAPSAAPFRLAPSEVVVLGALGHKSHASLATAVDDDAALGGAVRELRAALRHRGGAAGGGGAAAAAAPAPARVLVRELSAVSYTHLTLPTKA